VAYRAVIESIAAAWKRRDYRSFAANFTGPDGKEPFNPERIYGEYKFSGDVRLGSVMYNGASAVFQMISPEPADPVHGICSGMAEGHLIAISFYPGLDEAVARDLKYVGSSTLAEQEWTASNG